MGKGIICFVGDYKKTSVPLCVFILVPPVVKINHKGRKGFPREAQRT
jgi:hypothetical protein